MRSMKSQYTPHPGAISLPAQPFHRWKQSKSCSNLYQLLHQSLMSVMNCCSTTQPGSLLSLPAIISMFKAVRAHDEERWHLTGSCAQKGLLCQGNLSTSQQQWQGNERETSPKCLSIQDVCIVTHGSSSQSYSSQVCRNVPFRVNENKSCESWSWNLKHHCPLGILLPRISGFMRIMSSH